VFIVEDLISLIEQQEPCVSNAQGITTVPGDQILDEEAATVDSLIEYVLLTYQRVFVAGRREAWVPRMLSTSRLSCNKQKDGVTNEDAECDVGGDAGGPPSNAVSPKPYIDERRTVRCRCSFLPKR
jgi:hypothetical protein